MRIAMSRAGWGNALLLACLAATAIALARWQADPWWQAMPGSTRWLAAGLSLLVLAGLWAWALWRRSVPPATADAADFRQGYLLLWASQTGFARQLAEHTAQALAAAGQAAHCLPLDAASLALLPQCRRALFIASTTGEGDPPDHALDTLAALETTALGMLEYAVLALGDSYYQQFCAFGRQLDAALAGQGARPLFARVEVDAGDATALRQWQQQLMQLAGTDVAGWEAPDYQTWQLLARQHVNPGSPGGAVHHLTLRHADAARMQWQPGDIAEVLPGNSDTALARWLAEAGLDGEALVDGAPLVAHLRHARLPPVGDAVPDAAALVAALQPLPQRDYSIASIPAEHSLQLLVREMRDAGGEPGLGSGWLCLHTEVGGTVRLRIRPNPGFHPAAASQPLILIGNGTGIAGLRAHLAWRASQPQAAPVWLLFGERRAASDAHFADDLARWRQAGVLAELDAVFSREGGTQRYVQDALRAQGERLRQWVEAGAVVLVCGSREGMAPAVDAVIAEVLGEAGRDALRAQGRYRRDVY